MTTRGRITVLVLAPFDPPEWSPQRRDFLKAEPLKIDAEGCIQLSEAPGMGYTLDEGRLLATRIG